MVRLACGDVAFCNRLRVRWIAELGEEMRTGECIRRRERDTSRRLLLDRDVHAGSFIARMKVKGRGYVEGVAAGVESYGWRNGRGMLGTGEASFGMLI